MLKISFSETSSEERWTLHGRLTAPWVGVLRARWKKNHRSGNARACIVDLNEIKFIDKSGRRLLRIMAKQKAQCIASGIYSKHILENLTAKSKHSLFERLAGSFFAAVIAACIVRFGAPCMTAGIYVNRGLDQLRIKAKGSLLTRLAGFFFAAIVTVLAVFIGAATAQAQNSAVTGSVPSGPASDQVLELALRDAIKMALRYNLGAIESGQNTQIARGQRLLALSNSAATSQRRRIGERPASEPRDVRAQRAKNRNSHCCWTVQLQLSGCKRQPNTVQL